MKNSLSTNKTKSYSNYFSENIENKSTDINILLNRVRLDQKRETRKVIIFSVAVFTFAICFGALIF